jgi:hypothetical protein
MKWSGIDLGISLGVIIWQQTTVLIARVRNGSMNATCHPIFAHDRKMKFRLMFLVQIHNFSQQGRHRRPQKRVCMKSRLRFPFRPSYIQSTYTYTGTQNNFK